MNEPHPHRAGTYSWITFLVTGPDANLEKFFTQAPIEIFDSRGQTLRCRAHDFEGDRGMKYYGYAVDAAKRCDVTLQDLVCLGVHGTKRKFDICGGATATVQDVTEEYPIVNLGSHGMKWSPAKKD